VKERACALSRFGLTAAAALLLLGVLQVAAAESEYRLGPEDKLRLKVYEWRASQDEVFGWEALNDEYALGPAGELSLPLVGTIPAAGATRDELAGLIADRLGDRMGLGRRPTVAVEIVEYRPFYIVGPVEKPGAYPYRPGLTLLKALSLAGGLRTASESGTRAVISGMGDIDVLLLQRDEAVARLSRLRAELAGTGAFEVPPELAGRTGEPAVARLLEQERAIFAARQDAYRTRMAALEQLRKNLETEVPAQVGLLASVKAQGDSLRDEVATVGSVVSGREVRELQREITKLDGERLIAETSLLRAKQEVSRAQVDIIGLRTQHEQDLAGEIRDTQGQLDQLGHRLETAASLVEDARIGDALGASEGMQRRLPVFSILRTGADGTSTEIAAEETTPIQPGDAIKVEIRRNPAASPDGRT
jgi:protein involved in polysaccharide export with SLBB domain